MVFRRMTKFQRRRALTGYAFISPWILGFLLFNLLPIISVFYLSFTNYSLGRNFRIIGWANYVRMFTRDRLVGISAANTLYYTVFAVPLSILCGFLLALLLNTKVKGINTFRTIFYVPSIMPVVSTSMIFLWLFHPQLGILNYLLGSLNIKPIPWLTSPAWSKPSLILMSLWGVGGGMIVYLAGLQGIPEQLYEAARIDGATGFHQFIYVTIPLMTPTILFNLIMGIINSFQVFTQAFIMTNGGPLNSTLFYMLHLYNNAFSFFRMGYASALAVFLFLAILILTILIMRTSNRWVYYEV